MQSRGRREGLIKAVITDVLLIGLSSALLWHFSNIWRYGKHLVGEPNVVIRSLETAGLLVILIFGIVKYIIDIRRTKKEEVRDKDK